MAACAFQGGDNEGVLRGGKARGRRAAWLGRLLIGTALIFPGLIFPGLIPLATGAAAAQGAPSSPTAVAQAGELSFAIAPQSLDGALAAFSAATRIQVLTPGEITRGVASPGVTGRLSVRDGLNRLLAGTNLSARFVTPETVTVERLAAGGDVIQLAPVQVEGRAPAGAGALPPSYAGGQVATGGRIGALGNRDVMGVPFSITSYTSEVIRNQQAETIGEALANDPAVRRAYGFGNFAEQFVIRGFPLVGEDLSIDGLYGTAPRQIVAADLYERVEVLKGASAFLNGAAPSGSGIGGGVNLVPKRAGDEPLTRVTLGYGVDERVGGSVDVGRRFGADGAFGVRANAALRDGETAIDGEERFLGLGALAFDYRGERARVTIDVASQWQKIEQGRPVVYLGTAMTAVPDAPGTSDNYAQPWSYSQMRDTFAQVRGEYDLAPGTTVHAAAGARWMREDGDFSSPTVTSLNGAGTVRRLTVPREDDAQSGQLGLRSEQWTGPVRHRIDAGASALRTANHNSFEFGATQPTNFYDGTIVPRPATTSAAGSHGNPPKVSETELRSLYVSDTLSVLDDRIMVMAGLRRQQLHIQGFNRAGGRNANYDESAVTPVVGVVVRPMPQLSLYANRIEGLAQGPTAPATAVNAGTVFAPYRSTQYEVGGKLDLGTFGASLALFQTRQPSGVTDSTTLVFGVDGEQRNRGIELMLYGEPIEGLRLLGGVTFVHAELTDTGNPATEGSDPVGVPDYQMNASVEWDLPFLPQVTVSGRAVHTSSQYLDTANRLRLPDWTRFDLGARMTTEIRNQPVTFRATIENVTNTSYWASSYGGYLTQGNPLTARLSASVDF